jgi:CrcB protein
VTGGGPPLPRLHRFALVGAGGAVGGLLRYGLITAMPEQPGAFPWTTFTINAVGSFALGLLVAGFVGRRAAPAWVRPALGTGLLGGFTTFSAYAHAVDLLATGNRAGVAVAYLVGSVLAGVVGAAMGIAVGVRLPTRGAVVVPDGGGPR